MIVFGDMARVYSEDRPRGRAGNVHEEDADPEAARDSARMLEIHTVRTPTIVPRRRAPRRRALLAPSGTVPSGSREPGLDPPRTKQPGVHARSSARSSAGRRVRSRRA